MPHIVCPDKYFLKSSPANGARGVWSQGFIAVLGVAPGILSVWLTEDSHGTAGVFSKWCCNSPQLLLSLDL